jgi:hypothetical protein
MEILANYIIPAACRFSHEAKASLAMPKDSAIGQQSACTYKEITQSLSVNRSAAPLAGC